MLIVDKLLNDETRPKKWYLL